MIYFLKRTVYYTNTKPCNISFKITFNLNISIQRLLQKILVSLSYKRASWIKIGKPLINNNFLKKTTDFVYNPVMKTERHASLAHLCLLLLVTLFFFPTSLKNMVCQALTDTPYVFLFLAWAIRKFISFCHPIAAYLRGGGESPLICQPIPHFSFAGPELGMGLRRCRSLMPSSRCTVASHFGQ